MDTLLDFSRFTNDVKKQCEFRRTQRKQKEHRKWKQLQTALQTERQNSAVCREEKGALDDQLAAHSAARTIYQNDFYSAHCSLYYLIYYWYRLWPALKTIQRPSHRDSLIPNGLMSRTADLWQEWEDIDVYGPGHYTTQLFEHVEQEMLLRFPAALDLTPRQATLQEKTTKASFFTIHNADGYFTFPHEALMIHYSQPECYSNWDEFFQRFFFPVLCFRAEMRFQERVQEGSAVAARSSAEDVRDYLASMVIAHKLLGTDRPLVDDNPCEKGFWEVCGCIFHMLCCMEDIAISALSSSPRF